MIFFVCFAVLATTVKYVIILVTKNFWNYANDRLMCTVGLIILSTDFPVTYFFAPQLQLNFPTLKTAANSASVPMALPTPSNVPPALSTMRRLAFAKWPPMSIVAPDQFLACYFTKPNVECINLSYIAFLVCAITRNKLN